MAGKITGGARKPSAGRGGNGRPLAATDNLSPEEKAKRAAEEKAQREEAEAIQLMSIVARIKQALPEVETARAALKGAQEKVNDIFRAAKAQSKDFERGRIMELVEDSKAESRRDVTRNEAVRARFRRLMGLPVGDIAQDQLDLEARLPEVERDGQYWQSVGYTDGVSGAPSNPPMECVKAGHGNRYDQGWKDGQTILAVNMDKAQRRAAPPVAPKPEETEVERRAREAKETAKAKESLANLGKDKLPDDPKAVGAQAAADFEADQAELAAQTTRKAVQAAREADASQGADDVTV